MRAYKSAGFGLVAIALGALQARAQDAKPVEVTPYVALSSDVGSPVGAAITFPVRSKFSIETDLAYRRAEGNIGALSVGASLLYDLPRVGQSTPYLAAGVGLSQYGALVASSDGSPIGTRRALAMTVNAGGGLKMPMKTSWLCELMPGGSTFWARVVERGFALLRASPSGPASARENPRPT